MKEYDYLEESSLSMDNNFGELYTEYKTKSNILITKFIFPSEI